MVAKYELIVDMALKGVEYTHLPTIIHDDITRYHNKYHTVKQSKQWVDDGNIVGPSPDTYEWNIPTEFKELDIENLCYQRLIDLGLNTDEYITRVAAELLRVDDKGMYDFVRTLVWIVDTLRSNKLIWGRGRGSSCASLIMFLLGINKVDPVLYDIDMEEFYK
jgi:DNA polymerase III alpha subunit